MNSSYTVSGAVYSTKQEALMAVAGEWLGAGGLNSKKEIMEILDESTSEYLAEELLFNWNVDDWCDKDGLIDAFEKIRANPGLYFSWDD